MEINVHDDLSKKMFSDIEFCTSNAEINIQGIYGENIDIDNMNGTVDGIMKATEKLRVATTNAEITGTYTADNVSLITTNKNIAVETVLANKMNLKTTNGSINGTCVASTEIAAQTSGGTIGINVGFPNNVPPENLNITANSTNDQVSLRVPSNYEGSFDLETTNGTAKVGPIGDIVMRKDKKHQKTGKKGQGNSEVNVSSINANVSLTFV